MSERIAAVVLAAGMSKRMGKPKALLPLGGLPMIARVIEPLVKIGSVEPIVVVTGHHAEQVRGAMDGCDVQFVHNPNYESGGMLSSVKAGCRAIVDRCDAFLLLLGDQPLLTLETYRKLLALPLAASRIQQPCFNGKRGHPILFRADCIDDILALPGSATLKTFTQQISDARLIEVDDSAVVTDIDTPQDYDRALLEYQAHRSEPCQPKV